MNKRRIMTAAASFFSLAACAPAPTAYHSPYDDDVQVADNVHVSDDKPVFGPQRIECRSVKVTGSRIPINICGSRKPAGNSALLGVINGPGGGAGGSRGGGGTAAEGSCGGDRD